MNRTKVFHLGYYHSVDDIRIFEKECKSLNETNKYEIAYITSNRNSDNVEEITDGIYRKIIPLVDKRFVRLFVYLKDVYNCIQEEKPQVCHIHEFVLFPLAMKIKRKNIKLILDFHENDLIDWSKKIEKKYGRIISKIFKKIMAAYEKSCVLKADGIITVDRNIEMRLKKYGCNTFLIPNYPIIDFEKNSINNEAEKGFRNRKVCFAGGYSDTWCIKSIMKSIEDIKDCGFILAGFGDEGYLAELKTYDSWEKTVYCGKVTHAVVQNEIYPNSSIGMALLKYSESWKDGPLGNTKIFEFMYAGLPVICSDFPIWREIIEKNECGVCVNPNNIDEIRNAIEMILSDERRYIQMGKNGKKLVLQKYNWNALSSELLRLYESII